MVNVPKQPTSQGAGMTSSNHSDERPIVREEMASSQILTSQTTAKKEFSRDVAHDPNITKRVVSEDKTRSSIDKDVIIVPN